VAACRPASTIDTRPLDPAWTPPVAHAPPGPELRYFERVCAVEQVWQVEVDHVVANQHIGVALQNQVTPPQQQRLLIVKRHHFCNSSKWQAGHQWSPAAWAECAVQGALTAASSLASTAAEARGSPQPCPTASRVPCSPPAPEMGAQDLRVMMLRTVGSVRPNSVTSDAIWMTGSLSGSGKWPCGAGARSQAGGGEGL
jgi:hypothetical protein